MQASRSREFPGVDDRPGLMFLTPSAVNMSGVERQINGLTSGSTYQFRMHASTNSGMTPNGLQLLVSVSSGAKGGLGSPIQVKCGIKQWRKSNRDEMFISVQCDLDASIRH